MATNNKWERHEYYQKYGVYPETIKQQKAREAKGRDAQSGSTEPAAAPLSPQLEDHVAKVVEAWHKANPGFR
jgi:hypothetical protein